MTANDRRLKWLRDSRESFERYARCFHGREEGEALVQSFDAAVRRAAGGVISERRQRRRQRLTAPAEPMRPSGPVLHGSVDVMSPSCSLAGAAPPWMWTWAEPLAFSDMRPIPSYPRGDANVAMAVRA